VCFVPTWVATEAEAASHSGRGDFGFAPSASCTRPLSKAQERETGSTIFRASFPVSCFVSSLGGILGPIHVHESTPAIKQQFFGRTVSVQRKKPDAINHVRIWRGVSFVQWIGGPSGTCFGGGGAEWVVHPPPYCCKGPWSNSWSFTLNFSSVLAAPSPCKGKA
jgi:hypothetical protein